MITSSLKYGLRKEDAVTTLWYSSTPLCCSMFYVTASKSRRHKRNPTRRESDSHGHVEILYGFRFQDLSGIVMSTYRYHRNRVGKSIDSGSRSASKRRATIPLSTRDIKLYLLQLIIQLVTTHAHQWSSSSLSN